MHKTGKEGALVSLLQRGQQRVERFKVYSVGYIYIYQSTLLQHHEYYIIIELPLCSLESAAAAAAQSSQVSRVHLLLGSFPLRSARAPNFIKSTVKKINIVSTPTCHLQRCPLLVDLALVHHRALLICSFLFTAHPGTSLCTSPPRFVVAESRPPVSTNEGAGSRQAIN